LYGAQVGNNALFARGPETRITTPTNNPEGPNPGGNDLIRILADDVDVAGFLLDGNNPALPASTVMGNGIDIHARRAITNIDVDGNRVGRSGFQIFNNVIKNFAEDAIVFSNAGTPNTGGYMVQNDISNYGAGNNFPYAGVYLENGATIATLSYNRFVESAGGNWGIFSISNTTSPSQFWQGNTITTGQNSKGIVVNKQTGGSLIISDNLFLAGPGVTVTPGTSLSVAVQVQNMTSGSNLILSNNNIGTAGGTYDRGFDFFNIGNAQLIGGIISNSIIGINVDAEDVLLSPSTGNTNLQILNPNMFVPSNGVGAFLRGLSTGNDTFNINVPGNLNSVTFAGSKVSYSGLNNLLVDGQGGTNSFNINFGGGTVPTTINVLNSGSTGANILNIYGTSGSDLFNINTLFANTFILNTSNLVGYNGIATLNVNGPAFPGDSTPVTPTATDAGDSATITVSASTVVIFNGGNPNLPLGSPSGDKLYVRKGGTLILSPDFGPNYGKDGFLFTNGVFDNVGWTNME
jgi:hypothetical protein